MSRKHHFAYDFGLVTDGWIAGEPTDHQVFEKVYKKNFRDGEEMLMLAVLEDAVQCFQEYALATRPLLRREKLRNVIETITSKTVLILGRFTPERKAILDALADEVRLHKLIPMIFDFERSTNRDLTETIKVLAGLSLFVIADVTNPKSSPLELQATVPDYRIPFVIIIQETEKPFAMVDDLKKYDWVLDPILTYRSAESLRKAFKNAVLDRAWEKHKELNSRKAIGMTTKSIEDFLGHDADA